MACLSPSPSGSGRRLSELLEEKQEPFVLDLHLLEKGCSSSRLLDTAHCWPTAAAGGGKDGAAAAVLRRLTSKKSKAAKATTARKQQPLGLLQLLLSKILGGGGRARAAPAPAAQRQRKPVAALRFSDSFKLAATNPAAVAPAPYSDGHLELDAVKTAAAAGAMDTKAHGDAAAERYDDSYSDDDDEEKQQLSPVSVLDHPFESSPVHVHGKPPPLSPSVSKGAAASMTMDVVFRDLLDAAYSPALLAQLLASSEDLLLLSDAAADEDDDSFYGGEYHRTSPKNLHRDDEDESASTATAAAAAAAAYWEELARVSELVASELPTSKLAAADVQPERRDVASEVEAALFDALVRELVVELRSCC